MEEIQIKPATTPLISQSKHPASQQNSSSKSKLVGLVCLSTKAHLQIDLLVDNHIRQRQKPIQFYSNYNQKVRKANKQKLITTTGNNTF